MRREVLVVATRKKEWFDDDAFWRELYPFMFPKERIADADEQIAKALALNQARRQVRPRPPLRSGKMQHHRRRSILQGLDRDRQERR